MTGEQAAQIARKHGLGMAEAAALKALAEDEKGADAIAKTFSEDKASGEADKIAAEVWGSGGIGGKI